MELKYVETIILPGGAPSGNVQSCAWRTNSPYDPNLALGGGHQPMYFDQLGTFYGFYSVLSSRISVKFQNTSFGPYLAVLRVQDNQTAPTSTFDTYLEQPGNTCRIVTNANAVTLTRRWSCKGMDRSDNTGNIGNTGSGSNPGISPIFAVAVCMQDPSGVFAASNPQITATIHYKMLLTQRLDVSSS